jgi:hypothetical protein
MFESKGIKRFESVIVTTRPSKKQGHCWPACYYEYPFRKNQSIIFGITFIYGTINDPWVVELEAGS